MRFMIIVIVIVNDCARILRARTAVGPHCRLRRLVS
jgi:hypothetical protein